MKPVVVGVIGCGNISPIYFTNLCGMFSQYVHVKGAVDLIPERSQKAQERFGFPVIYKTDVELLADPEIELVLNITTPPDHYALCRMALEAGKNVYVEKPLSLEREDGKDLVELAARKGLLLGCSPDTFMGGGLQTCRKAIDDGLIGTPIGCTAYMMSHGPENWHPNPDFFYKYGGGPMLDMGPYYITALVTLLGPVTSVIGAASHLRAERTIGSGPRAGEVIPVTVHTHTTGVLTHASGALSTLVMSFDAVATRASKIEVHGERGSLVVPDPNVFDGEVQLRGPGDADWRSLPVSAGYVHASRGFGLADLLATPPGQEPRAGRGPSYLSTIPPRPCPSRRRSSSRPPSGCSCAAASRPSG
jgi:predicted dehydrogenase